MTNDLYRGYEIKTHANGGFYWTDERGFDHTGNIADSATHIDARKGCYATQDAAMDSIDRYKRSVKAAQVPA